MTELDLLKWCFTPYTEREWFFLVLGVLIGLVPYTLGVLHRIGKDTRWLGQERRRAERRKEGK